MPRGAPIARLAERLRRELSTTLARNSLLVFVCSLAARILGLGKELLIAGLFGVGGELDAYVLALLIPSFLINVFGGAFSSALVPALGSAAAKRGRAAARGLALRGALSLALLVGVAACGLLLLPARALHVFWPGADPARLELTRSLLAELTPLYVLGCLSNALGATANYFGNFKTPALAGILNTATAIIAIALLHGSLAIHALPLGLDLGAAVEFGLVAAFLLREGRGSAETPPALRALAPLLRNWLLLALGSSLFGLSPFIDNAIASALPVGSISALSYAAKLPQALSTLLGLTLGTVLLPHFADLAQRSGPGELWRTARGAARRILLLTLPLALIGAALSHPLAELLYQRGRFDARATEAVAFMQAFYFLECPIFLVSVTAARMVQAMSRFRFLLAQQAGLLCVNAAASLVLTRFLGAVGIPISTILLYALSAGSSLGLIRRNGRRTERPNRRAISAGGRE